MPCKGPCPEEALQAFRGTGEAYGLRFYHLQPISADGDVHKNLATEIGRFSDLGYTQVVLTLHSPEPGAGHAVNLIFDKARGIYSIEDDNVGRIDFSSLKELQEQGKSFFEAFYPNDTVLKFQCYRLA